VSLDIYNLRIRTLAQEAHGAGRLSHADASATRDSPICGDRVTVEVVLRDGIVAAVAHDVKGCALCRASAAVIGQHAAGKAADEIVLAGNDLEAMLKREGPVPAGWEELECFLPVRGMPSRHGCVLLPFEALCAALKNMP
jgi:nitrogen fixation NifU-like protein